jgi:hypothetical protein
VFDNDINHIPMNSEFKCETRILHSDESGSSACSKEGFRFADSLATHRQCSRTEIGE